MQVKHLKSLINRIDYGNNISNDELTELISLFYDEYSMADLEGSEDLLMLLKSRARAKSKSVWGNRIYQHCMIEISNRCQNDCYYCDIRHGNTEIPRYNLKKSEILETIKPYYKVGIRDFILLSGEKAHKSDEITDIVHYIKSYYPDTTLTLGLGIADKKAYNEWREAGADKYMLREETIDEARYMMLHPAYMKLEKQVDSLYDLRNLGYQVDMRFTLGTPYQSPDSLAEMLCFIKDFGPSSVALSPFVPSPDSEFRHHNECSLTLITAMTSLLRLLMPKLIIPATSTMDAISEQGTIQGILSGANITIHNITPDIYRNYRSDINFGSVNPVDEALILGLDKLGYELFYRHDYDTKRSSCAHAPRI
ncbi:MAG: [FeFe] hydrogenase H-cluster radical SAM maturase HydE [Clostridiales Family XIII bacterium]|jgi:biotin synthase|nr:[FeFe] hydrogenase H-cluster radical SAM maturase HydE [Clostridiales Family XIII bacterium]